MMALVYWSFRCEVLGWHTSYRCGRCGRRCLMDSNGSYFAVGD